jgi:hypothetical protein
MVHEANRGSWDDCPRPGHFIALLIQRIDNAASDRSSWYLDIPLRQSTYR